MLISNKKPTDQQIKYKNHCEYKSIAIQKQERIKRSAAQLEIETHEKGKVAIYHIDGLDRVHCTHTHECGDCVKEEFENKNKITNGSHQINRQTELHSHT